MACYVPRWKAPSWTRYIGPFMLLVLAVYCTWGFAHRLCYDKIYKKLHHRSVAIGLICTVSFLDALLIFIWCQIVIIGPGRLPKVPPYMLVRDEIGSDVSSMDEKVCQSLIPPLLYQSGPNGQPIWCTACGSVKTDRAHHSSDLKCCVPRFDHKCLWLCAIIGKDNYRLFLQFGMYMAALTVIVVVSICVFLGKIRHELDHNLVAILIISLVGSLMSGTMLFTHLMCIAKNRSSIEVMARNNKQNIPSYCCYYNSKDGCRYVVQLDKDEYSKLWCKKSLWLNFSEILGSNVLLWIIPVGFPNCSADQDLESGKRTGLQKILGRYYESYGEKTKEIISRKIQDKKYLTKFYAYGDKFIQMKEMSLDS